MQTSPQQNWRRRQDLVTDDWEGYHRLIPESQLFTGKDLTVPIEQDKSNIRHFLAWFRRRTKVVSKAVAMSLATI